MHTAPSRVLFLLEYAKAQKGKTKQKKKKCQTIESQLSETSFTTAKQLQLRLFASVPAADSTKATTTKNKTRKKKELETLALSGF